MTPWLSILLPSKRTEGLARVLTSLHTTATDFQALEIVIVTPTELVPWPGSNIRTFVSAETSVAALFDFAYQQSRAPWVFFVNDDVVMETPDWDGEFKRRLPADGIGVLWPNDLIFRDRLSCFPVISRIVLDRLVPFAPAKHYTIDAAMMDIVPESRRVYLPHVVLRHRKDDDVPAEVIRDTLLHDRQIFKADRDRRKRIRQSLEALMR